MIIASTCLRNFSIPAVACAERSGPSLLGGVVTIATVNISISCANSAITGVAPVPVPPPIPAVRKSISVPRARNRLRTLSSEAIACSAPTSALFPAPNPSSPRRILFSSAICNLSRSSWSVLQAARFTPSICIFHMCSIALPPAPPTPIAIIREGWLLIDIISFNML